MAYFRFHKSRGIIPGIRVNLSKSGPSLSLGPTGLKLNIGPRGTRRTVGLPGSGLSVISRKSWRSANGKSKLSQASATKIDAAIEGMTKDEKRAWIVNYADGLSLDGVKKYRDEFEAHIAEHPEEVENEKADLEDARQILAEAIKTKERSSRFTRIVWFIVCALLGLLLYQILKMF
jgi:hypothetical protein